jgi:hypothetical protein
MYYEDRTDARIQGVGKSAIGSGIWSSYVVNIFTTLLEEINMGATL